MIIIIQIMYMNNLLKLVTILLLLVYVLDLFHT